MEKGVNYTHAHTHTCVCMHIHTLGCPFLKTMDSFRTKV